VTQPLTDARLAYARIWRRYSRALETGASDIDIDGSSAPIYTLVARLPDSVAIAAHDALCSGHDWSGHYVYPPSTLHMTVLFLTPYLGVDARTGEAEQTFRTTRARGIVAEALSDMPPMRFRARGLNVFASTVFLQLLPHVPGAPREIRERLSGRMRAARFLGANPEAYEAGLAWDLAFANVVRFRRGVNGAVVKAVEKLRDVDFGDVTLSKVEYVRTDKLLSSPRTTSLASFDLR
jgi:hypothetical protein